MDFGLLWGIVADYFGLLSFPGRKPLDRNFFGCDFVFVFGHLGV